MTWRHFRKCKQQNLQLTCHRKFQNYFVQMLLTSWWKQGRAGKSCVSSKSVKTTRRSSSNFSPMRTTRRGNKQELKLFEMQCNAMVNMIRMTGSSNNSHPHEPPSASAAHIQYLFLSTSGAPTIPSSSVLSVTTQYSPAPRHRPAAYRPSNRLAALFQVPPQPQPQQHAQGGAMHVGSSKMSSMLFTCAPKFNVMTYSYHNHHRSALWDHEHVNQLFKRLVDAEYLTWKGLLLWFVYFLLKMNRISLVFLGCLNDYFFHTLISI